MSSTLNFGLITRKNCAPCVYTSNYRNCYYCSKMSNSKSVKMGYVFCGHVGVLFNRLVSCGYFAFLPQEMLTACLGL